MRPFLIARDGFYRGQSAWRAAQAATYHGLPHVTGLRSTTVYHPHGVRERLEQALGLAITRWDQDPADENGVFYQGLAQGRAREIPGVHSDFPLTDVTAVVYLTPDLPVNCGTSLWMHRATGLTTQPTAADARRLGRTVAELRALLVRDYRRRERWVEIDRVGYRTNRLVAYPSGLLHSATHHWGGSLGQGRLYQTFRVGVAKAANGPARPGVFPRPLSELPT
ncbi:MAG: DUF6445 family protein [Proteobacteria bacterium]|nr:DUF6445 family protein [Pseudomonadota bacterium]